eukprot:10944342-Alexandrium_andersonii.AAC.1
MNSSCARRRTLGAADPPPSPPTSRAAPAGNSGIGAPASVKWTSAPRCAEPPQAAPAAPC